MTKTATINTNPLATITTTIGKAAICILPIIPAVRVNLDAAAGQGEAWTIFAIGSVLAGAVFIELCLEGRGLARCALFAVLATFFVALNVLNAIGNAASHSDVARDVASSRLSQKQRLSDRRNELSQARKEQVTIAGNTTPDSIEAEIRAAKSSGSKQWASTFGCDVSWTVKSDARTFCASIAELEKKKAAALRRDQIDAELSKIDAQDVEAPPSSIDSYTANVGRFLTLLGYSVDDKVKELVAASRDWLKGIGVELLAAFGPAALLCLLTRPVHQYQAPQQLPQAVRKPEKPVKAPAAPILVETNEATPVPVSATMSDDAAISEFITRQIETAQGEFISATALYNAWKADCADNNIEPGSQKSFSNRIQRRVGYDRNNGRPRYLNVRLKATALPAASQHRLGKSSLRLVANN